MRTFARRVINSVGPLRRCISRWRGTLIHQATRPPSPTTRLGSAYGGWTVLKERLNASSVVYSVGVGTDISFDLALIARFRCAVQAYDPTPVCRQWVESQKLPPQFHFHPIGLSASDGEASFQAPTTDGQVSFSLSGAGAGHGSVMCPVRRLATLADSMGHSHIDLLKMDIEGFEYQVIDDILGGPLRPDQWLIEFHHTMYGHQAAETKGAVAKIIAAGYTLFSVSDIGHEYSFARIG